MSNPEDLEVVNKLREALGDFFAEKLIGDAAWAKAVLGVSSDFVERS